MMKKIWLFISKHRTLCILLIIFSLFKFVYSPTIIVGESMQPTYFENDIVFGNRFVNKNKLRQGDVVVFSNRATLNSNFIKRIVGCPGDTVQIKNKRLYINNIICQDSHVGEINESGIANKKIILNDDEYFVLGDNHDNSMDSRSFGAIKAKDIHYLILDSHISYTKYKQVTGGIRP